MLLVSGFLIMIAIGTLLLLLPWSAADRHSIGFIDALFTATSAVCVTGLIVKDTPVDFSLFGQSVILLLIQAGGLGYAGSTMLMALVIGRKIGLRERLMFKQALNLLTMEGLVKYLRWLVLVIISIECLVAVLLAIRFWQDVAPEQAIYRAVFLSVSALNNAGFSVFSDSLGRYRFDWAVNATIGVAVMLGSVGFIVLYELQQYLRRRIFRISIHAKLSLIVTAVLLLLGGLGVWQLEASNPSTLSGEAWYRQAMVGFFYSVVSRTSGFSTMDISGFQGATLYLLILLMVVGGSPASTAGGIKTTTAGVIFATLWSFARGRPDVTLFHRRLPFEVVGKAFFLAFLAFAIVTGATLLLLTVEQLEFAHFLAALFEVASAFGTVGLSTGDGGTLSYSATFGTLGKLIIIVGMFVGRLGPITIGIAVLSRGESRIRYPEEEVMIG
jgi:trk system potassium uptake protein